MDSAPGPIAGIDLGTTFSSIAFLNAFGRAEVIPTAEGARSVPSVVLFDPDSGEALVGQRAKERSVECPDRVVEFVKREMGDPDWTFSVDGKQLRPQTISAVILRKLCDMGESVLKTRPESAVITCPAYFGDLERQATADAGTLAGLEVLSVFNEPTAAALAYGLHHAAKDERVRALVYDLGGGTFDVTVLELRGRRVEVLATAGEHRLGGKDWDDELLNHVAEEFLAEHGEDPRDDITAMQDLRNRCEAAKVSLSSKRKARVFCRAYGKVLKLDLTRQLFEELTHPLLLQTKTYLDQVLDMARLRYDDVDVVLPVGGSSHMPQVGRLLRETTGRAPEDVLDPDLAVVQGAVYYAALLRAEQGFSIKVRTVRQPKGREAKEELPALPPSSAPAEELPALPPATLEDAPELMPMLPGAAGPAGAPERPADLDTRRLDVAEQLLAALGEVDQPVFAMPMLPPSEEAPALPAAPPRAPAPPRRPSGRPARRWAPPPGRRPRAGGPRRPRPSSAAQPALPPAGAKRPAPGAGPRPPRAPRPARRAPSAPEHALPPAAAKRRAPSSAEQPRPPRAPRRAPAPRPAPGGARPPRAPANSDLLPSLPAASMGDSVGGITDTATFDFRDLVALEELTIEEASPPLPTPGAPPAPPKPIPQRRQRAVQQVNARSLGVLIHRQGQPAVKVMLPRNTKLPATERQQFYTLNDNQTGVKVVVLEGEEHDPELCTRIGECVISGLPPRPKGQPVEIGYSYDEDGQILVTAMDLGSGIQARVELKREGSLDRREMAAAAQWLDGVCR